MYAAIEQEGRLARSLPSALAEEAGTVVVMADDKLLKVLGDTPPYAHLGHPLTDTGSLILSTK
ncbi:MAG: hypothetical protein M3441_28335 [Chloroflexota bacterium]|jgi:hypothetical protein|nr:hypothetical protein [Chloroflexota bacterium]